MHALVLAAALVVAAPGDVQLLEDRAPTVHPVNAAWADAQKLAPDYAEHTRYFRLDDFPPWARPDLIRVLNVQLNQLSTASELVPAVIVPGTDGALVRINTLDYGSTFAKTFEKLVSPWDSQIVEEDEYQWYGYRNPDGTIKYDHKERTGKRVKVSRPAFWLQDTPELQARFGQLVKLLGGTKVPITRAVWFITHTAAQADRSPTGYYDFLGIKSETDFQKLADFDAKLKRKRVEYREAVAISTVTLQPRALERLDVAGGSLWRSFDFRSALDKRNPLRVFGQPIEDAFRDPANVKDVASEQYIILPNDLWATGAFNNAGVPQDTAPDFAASDGRSTSTDKRVHVCISCTRCHRQGGLQSIDGWVKNFFPPPLELQVTDYETTRLLRQQYGRDLVSRLEIDRKPYILAVRRLTGWTSEEWSDQLSRVWSEYEDTPVGLDGFAARLNTTPEKLEAAIRATIAANQADPVLSVFVLKGDRAQRVPIRQLEEAIPLAQLALRGLTTPLAVTPKKK